MLGVTELVEVKQATWRIAEHRTATLENRRSFMMSPIREGWRKRTVRLL
jgi:hypothetical protein